MVTEEEASSKHFQIAVRGGIVFKLFWLKGKPTCPGVFGAWLFMASNFEAEQNAEESAVAIRSAMGKS